MIDKGVLFFFKVQDEKLSFDFISYEEKAIVFIGNNILFYHSEADFY